jgi:hypothetical protein
MPVHHVDVDHIRARLFDYSDLVTQAAEIS